MTTVIIKIEESANARAFKPEELIHKHEYDKIKRWINALIEKSTNVDEQTEVEDEDYGAHEAITLLGTRGSGKTSFLRTLLKEYGLGKQVEVLQIVDPTLIEEKGHIFLDVISRIQERVYKKLGETDSNIDNEVYRKKKEWDKLLKVLAHGLPMLDGVGGPMTEPSWQDAEFILSNGLLGVTSARKLKKHFDDLLKFSLGILGKSAFMIAFDDIDIDFRKGWTVLETIRKYFTSRKIIVILSGDMKLYSKAIRKHQWKNFGKALLINEAQKQKKMDVYNELVTTMESQYMQKVMRSERRIRLSTLAEKLDFNRSDFEILVESNPYGQRTAIADFYYRILSRLGIINHYQAEPYITFLLSQPIRTQIQFLAVVSADKSDQREIHITDAFLSHLYEKNVDVELLLSNPNLINLSVVKFLLKNETLVDFYQLQPTSTDSAINACLTVFSFLFNRAVHKSSALVFENLIKVGYLRNLAAGLTSNDSETSRIGPSVDELCRHAAILQDGILRDNVGNMTAYMRAVLNLEKENKSAWGGSIPLGGFAETAKKGSAYGEDRIDRVFARTSILLRTIAYIPLSVAKPTDKNNTLINYSIYSLLAAIGDLLKTPDHTSMPLLELSQVRTYNMPQFNKGMKSSNEIAIFGDEEDENSNNSLNELSLLIQNWKNEYYYPSYPVSSYLLGKISTRFFYASDNIDNRGEKGNLGDMFSDRIIAFLNAVLVEDAREYGGGDLNINLNNIVSNPKIFLDNLKAVQNSREKESFNFSSWILSCPLLLAYIDPDILNSISKVASFDMAEISEINIYYLLCKVSPGVKVDAPSNFIQKVARVRPRNNKMDLQVERLKNSGVPFELFDADLKVNGIARNSEIRKNYVEYFEVKNIGGKYLAELREYIKKHDLGW